MRKTCPNELDLFWFSACSKDRILDLSTLRLIVELHIKSSPRKCSHTFCSLRLGFSAVGKYQPQWWCVYRTMTDNRMSRRCHRCLRFVNPSRAFCARGQLLLIQLLKFSPARAGCSFEPMPYCNISYFRFSGTTSFAYSVSRGFLSDKISTPLVTAKDRKISAIILIRMKKKSKGRQSWRTPLLMVNSGESWPQARTLLRLLAHRNWMRKMNYFGTPFSERQCQRITRPTDSNFVFKSRSTEVVGAYVLRSVAKWNFGQHNPDRDGNRLRSHACAFYEY